MSQEFNVKITSFNAKHTHAKMAICKEDNTR